MQHTGLTNSSLRNIWRVDTFQSYTSEKVVNLAEYEGYRHACTAIYYLLEGEQFSSFHIQKSDEQWHFYTGSSLTPYNRKRWKIK
jgi:predicted cupin superfamily sugar epimerase